jgi:hypothetical protein
MLQNVLDYASDVFDLRYTRIGEQSAVCSKFPYHSIGERQRLAQRGRKRWLLRAPGTSQQEPWSLFHARASIVAPSL